MSSPNTQSTGVPDYGPNENDIFGGEGVVNMATSPISGSTTNLWDSISGNISEVRYNIMGSNFFQNVPGHLGNDDGAQLLTSGIDGLGLPLINGITDLTHSAIANVWPIGIGIAAIKGATSAYRAERGRKIGAFVKGFGVAGAISTIGYATGYSALAAAGLLGKSAFDIYKANKARGIQPIRGTLRGGVNLLGRGLRGSRNIAGNALNAGLDGFDRVRGNPTRAAEEQERLLTDDIRTQRTTLESLKSEFDGINRRNVRVPDEYNTLKNRVTDCITALDRIDRRNITEIPIEDDDGNPTTLNIERYINELQQEGRDLNGNIDNRIALIEITNNSEDLHNRIQAFGRTLETEIGNPNTTEQRLREFLTNIDGYLAEVDTQETGIQRTTMEQDVRDRLNNIFTSMRTALAEHQRGVQERIDQLQQNQNTNNGNTNAPDQNNTHQGANQNTQNGNGNGNQNQPNQQTGNGNNANTQNTRGNAAETAVVMADVIREIAEQNAQIQRDMATSSHAHMEHLLNGQGDRFERVMDRNEAFAERMLAQQRELMQQHDETRVNDLRTSYERELDSRDVLLRQTSEWHDVLRQLQIEITKLSIGKERDGIELVAYEDQIRKLEQTIQNLQTQAQNNQELNQQLQNLQEQLTQMKADLETAQQNKNIGDQQVDTNAQIQETTDSMSFEPNDVKDFMVRRLPFHIKSLNKSNKKINWTARLKHLNARKQGMENHENKRSFKKTKVYKLLEEVITLLESNERKNNKTRLKEILSELKN